MECAAVDGRGGAVHSYGALYAPLRTPDGELRRLSRGTKYRRAVQLKVGSCGRHDERGTREIFSFPLRIYRRVSFVRNTLFAEPRRVGEICGVTNGQEVVFADNWFTIDRHGYIPVPGIDSDFALCTARRMVRSSRIGLEDLCT